MKYLIATIATLFLAVIWATPVRADGCAGSFQLRAPAPVYYQAPQAFFVPAPVLAPAPVFGFQRSFNLSINRGFAFAPAPVAVAPFRSFNLSINRGFAPGFGFAPRARFFR